MENGQKTYNVLIMEDDDWIVYHAQDLFMVGCICPPIWTLLWGKGASLLIKDLFIEPEPLDQTIHFQTLNKYQSLSYLKFEQVFVTDIYDYNLTSAGLLHLQPWIFRTIAAGIIWLGLVILFYGLYMT